MNTKYICTACSHVMNPNELMPLNRVRCSSCGFRTLRKSRPDMIRKIKAR